MMSSSTILASETWGGASCHVAGFECMAEDELRSVDGGIIPFLLIFGFGVGLGLGLVLP